MKTLHSYSLARPFGGMNIPIAIQSLYIRDYCRRNNYTFKLPIVEWCMDNVYENLSTLLRQEGITDIGMTSIFILPVNDIKLKSLMYDVSPITFHFPLESLVVQSQDLFATRSRLQKIRLLSSNIRSVPIET